MRQAILAEPVVCSKKPDEYGKPVLLRMRSDLFCELGFRVTDTAIYNLGHVPLLSVDMAGHSDYIITRAHPSPFFIMVLLLFAFHFTFQKGHAMI
jgi:hypothetical protein